MMALFPGFARRRAELYAINIYSLHRQRTGSDPETEIFRDPFLLISILGWLLSTLWLLANA